MCIYYKKGGLTYIGEDHIFSAGIGGKMKVSQGIISDQFNTDISKIEQDFFRKGSLKVPRMMSGPGKKGSLSESKATKSEVHLLKNRDNDELYALAFTSLGKPYEIPHLCQNTVTGMGGFSCEKMPVEEALKTMFEFGERAIHSDGLKIKKVVENRLPEDIVLIGIKDGIEENFNCFVFQHENNKLPATKEAISLIGKGISISEKPVDSKYMPQVMDKIQHQDDHYRVYGKIAINFLAMIKGTDFVNQPEFDKIKNWIAYNDDYPHIAADHTNHNPLIGMGIPMPDEAHVVIILQHEFGLMAKVFLYGGYCMELVLAQGEFKKFSTDGLICDWKNQKEYRLQEYIAAWFDGNLPASKV